MELFSKEQDYAAFECLLEQTLESRPMRICAYCLMPNHWHFVLWPEHDGDLATFMQQLTTKHVRRWQLHRRRVGYGHVYQSRYKSFPVEKEEYFYQLRVTWSATRCGQAWSNVLNLGSGPVFGDDPRARRNRSNCSAIGPCPIREVGASWSTSRKQMRSWTRFAAAWPADSHTEARIGCVRRLKYSAWNQPSEHHIAQERLPESNDRSNKRACPPFHTSMTTCRRPDTWYCRCEASQLFVFAMDLMQVDHFQPG